MLTPDSVTGGERKLVGSVMFIAAENMEQVKEIVETDIYYTANVVSPFISQYHYAYRSRQWNPDRVVIAPFSSAVGLLGEP
jgi:hypothetical protein